MGPEVCPGVLTNQTPAAQHDGDSQPGALCAPCGDSQPAANCCLVYRRVSLHGVQNDGAIPHHGIAPRARQVLAEKQGADSLAFLKPFTWQLWLAILATLLGIAAITSALSRVSPLGRFEVRR